MTRYNDIVLQALPMGSLWRKCSRCELQKTFPRNKFVSDTLEAAEVELRHGVWTFIFSGEVKEYTPEKMIIDEMLSLPLPNSEDEKPSDEVLRFFAKWGPFGLYWLREKSLNFKNLKVNLREVTDDTEILFGQANVDLVDYWRLFHAGTLPAWLRNLSKTSLGDRQRNLKLSSPLILWDTYLDQYVEYWPLVYREFEKLVPAVQHWEEGLARELDDLFTSSTEVHIATFDRPPYEVRFNSLKGALVSLAAEAKSGWELKECPTCHHPFWTENKNKKYCHPDHQKNRPGTLNGTPKQIAFREHKHRLRSRLYRRRKAGQINAAKESELLDEITAALEESDLDKLEQRNSEIFKARPRGRKPRKGRAKK